MAKQPFETVVRYLFQIAAQAEFPTLNDQDLLNRYVEHRDGLALGELVRRYKGMVWHVCWRVLRHHQDVEDAFQATVMTLIRKSRAIVGHTSIEGWLHSTAFKIACTAKRDRQHQRAREARSTKMRKESYDDHGSRWELGEVLDKELTHIPEKYRSALILCYLEGLTWQEASQRLGISLDSLEWRLEQGRKRLKQRLSKYGIDLGSSIVMPQTMYGVPIPEVPPGLLERTSDMVRIVTLSNGVLETAGISPQVALLVKGALGMTLKVKLLLGSLFLSLLIVTAGAARYAGIFHVPLGTPQQDERSTPATKIPEEPKTKEVLLRKDLYGDPLPPEALARLGTVRFRSSRNSVGEIVFTPDSKAIGLLAMGEVPRLWNMKTGERVYRLADGLRGQSHVASSRLSADGRLVAYRTHPDKGRVGFHLREATTGKVIRTFEHTTGDDAIGYHCAISPDSKSFVAYLNDGLRLWDIASGQQMWEEKTDKKDFRNMQSLVFSPDGKYVAVGISRRDRLGANEANVELRDARTGKILRTLSHPGELGGAFSFSPDGHTLMVSYAAVDARRNSSVYLWDVATGKEQWHLDKKKHAYSDPVFSPNGKIIAVCEIHPHRHQEIGLYDIATGKKLGSCPEPEFHTMRNFVNHLTFSPDGKVLATMWGGGPAFLWGGRSSIRGERSFIRCWDVETRKVLALPTFGHESSVSFVAFAADGRTLISGGENQSVHLWDSFTGQKRRTLSEESRLRSPQNRALLTEGDIHAVSADGKIVAGVHLDLPAPDAKLSSPLPEQAKQGLAASIRGNICIWEAATGRELHNMRLGSLLIDVSQLALSPDGKFLAVWLSSGNADSVNNLITMWEIDSGKRIVEKIEGTYPIFSPDSKCLLTYKDGVFSLWEAATGKKLSSVMGVEYKGPGLTVTADWQTLVGFLFDKKAKRLKWYLNSLNVDKQSKLTLGRPRYLDGNSGYSLAVSPNGKMLAWSPANGIIHVVETATGAERARFQGHSKAVLSLSFSPDSRRLASGSSDTTILVWDVTRGWLDENGQLCAIRLSDPQVQQLWNALTGTDAARAGRAIWTLAAAPQQTVPFLTKQLSPIIFNNQPSAQKIAQLIKDLEDDNSNVRQKAFAELSKFGEAAEAGIRQALEKKPSLDVRRRLELLLGAIADQPYIQLSKNKIRNLRALEVLEQIGTPEACRLLETLGQGTPGIRQTEEARAALRRLQQRAHR